MSLILSPATLCFLMLYLVDNTLGRNADKEDLNLPAFGGLSFPNLPVGADFGGKCDYRFHDEYVKPIYDADTRES
ncbi:unnamed protein product [Allacma fusca]|uniref:Uncharacterized protein n=1 Tax=Allacma fusca TaxID=39272 RepID=A0A8J2PPE2_9HEXA|nr:unnamed protein product [Allacma fusca]